MPSSLGGDTRPRLTMGSSSSRETSSRKGKGKGKKERWSYKESPTPLPVEIQNKFVSMAYIPDMVRIFLGKGVNLNHQNDNGMTAMMVAAQYGNPESLKLLVKAGADPNIRNDEHYGFTPLMYALCAKAPKCATLLLDAGATINMVCTETKQQTYGTVYSGWNELMIAVDNDCGSMVSKLLDAGADVHHQTETGKTALSICYKSKYTKLLLDAMNIDDVNASSDVSDVSHSSSYD